MPDSPTAPEDIPKIEAYARESKRRLSEVNFHNQGLLHAALEAKYGVNFNQVIKRAIELADQGKHREADELANSVMILRGGSRMRLTFDPRLGPESAKLIKHEVIELRKKGQEERLQKVQLVSPTVGLLMSLREKKITLEDLHWREFEQVVAELLDQDGWKVALGRGSQDGGVDIWAERSVPGAGPILTVWQAKHLSNQRVGISVVRELADTVREYRASKGVIVTSSFLTKGALERVHKDTYLLGKMERNELLDWVHSQ